MADINVSKTAPHIIHSGDAFNHTVTPPGEQLTNWKPDPKDPTSHHHNFPHVYPNLMDTPTPQSVPSTSTHHRKYPHGQPATFSAGVHRQTRRSSARPKDKRVESTGEIPVKILYSLVGLGVRVGFGPVPFGSGSFGS